MFPTTNDDLLELNSRLDKDLEDVKVEPFVYDVEPKIAEESAVKALDLAEQLLLDIAHLLIGSQRYLPELAQDEAIKVRLLEARELLLVAAHQRDLADKEYCEYQEIRLDAFFLASSINNLLRSADENMAKGFTPLKIANYIVDSISTLCKATKGDR